MLHIHETFNRHSSFGAEPVEESLEVQDEEFETISIDSTDIRNELIRCYTQITSISSCPSQNLLICSDYDGRWIFVLCTSVWHPRWKYSKLHFTQELIDKLEIKKETSTFECANALLCASDAGLELFDLEKQVSDELVGKEVFCLAVDNHGCVICGGSNASLWHLGTRNKISDFDIQGYRVYIGTDNGQIFQFNPVGTPIKSVSTDIPIYVLHVMKSGEYTDVNGS
ncbi:hypothetical protein RF11_05521 [Thelohanellus kitauei]|uniref:Uncharacterized protein n=1 Tax=Thelohanellus kitauei TaxID=669202 RepID=A0A0C2IZ69_THEKT|nr:hypothetical protein RF11_05521 [Thelohanellus kitauei]